MAALKDCLPIRTSRLILRAPSFDDLDAIAAMHADPEVTRFLTPWSRDRSAYYIGRMTQHLESGGVDFLAVERADSHAFLGLAGLLNMATRFRDVMGHPDPLIEVAYRFARHAWGQGHATEAAAALLNVGFGPMGLERITAIANVRNEASNRVIRKSGLTLRRTFQVDSVDIHFYDRRRPNPG